MYRERFYLSEDIPDIFKQAEEFMDKTQPIPEIVREPIEVPMPTIRSNPNVYGPLKVTKKWYKKEKRKAMCKRAETRAEAEMEVIRLIAQRDRLHGILSKLDPLKKKDVKKIADINCRINVIDDYLKAYQAQYGFNYTELDHGSKLGRWLSKQKRKVKKVVRKVKKFFQKHADVFIPIGTAIASVVIAFVTRLLI